MREPKDTFILSTVWDINRKTGCQFKECPKYGWLNFIMGYESEGAPLLNYRVCPAHYIEVMNSWTQKFLPKILETFQTLDRKEWLGDDGGNQPGGEDGGSVL